MLDSCRAPECQTIHVRSPQADGAGTERQCFEDVSAGADATVEQHRQAIADGMLGSVLLTLGHREEAAKLLRESLDIAEQHDLQAVQLASRTNLGVLATISHQAGAALGHFDRSLGEAEGLQDPALAALVLINKARALRRAMQVASEGLL